MFKILIIDECSLFRQSLQQILCSRFAGVVIETAGDKLDGWKKAGTLLPHIIFVDIHMQGETGRELVKTLKMDQPGVPLVVFTRYDLPEYQIAARQAGADHSLPRDNFTGDQLLRLVENILSGQDINA